MDKSQEKPKKCFCARCFCPIEPEDQVNIDGQNFHKMCSTCCMCRKIPSTLKLFYGHVFCADCFRNHVLNRFKGETPSVNSNCWWMQWAPGPKPQPEDKENEKDKSAPDPKKAPNASCKPEDAPKRCICARCLQACDENTKIDIGGQSFHPQCARCYVCHCVPVNNVKIYYGQLFCEECFNRHVLGKNKENPREFFKSCFEQWQNNTPFADNMTKFMAPPEKESPPVMRKDAHPPSCRCGNHASQDWMKPNEPRKCRRVTASPVAAAPASEVANSVGGNTAYSWALSCESSANALPALDELPDAYESANHDTLTAEVEKIEKLTKYLHENLSNGKQDKKWKNFNNADTNSKTTAWLASRTTDTVGVSDESETKRWTNLQDPKIKRCCPKCLWQCGPIHSEYSRNVMFCSKNKSGVDY